MEKLKQVPLVLLCLFGFKALVISPSVTDICALVAMACLAAIFEYKANDSKYKKLEERFNTVAHDVSEAKKLMDSLRDNVSSVKLAQNYRQGSK